MSAHDPKQTLREPLTVVWNLLQMALSCGRVPLDLFQAAACTVLKLEESRVASSRNSIVHCLLDHGFTLRVGRAVLLPTDAPRFLVSTA
jgi:hypothetical protein